jgi:hypothetical protein
MTQIRLSGSFVIGKEFICQKNNHYLLKLDNLVTTQD